MSTHNIGFYAELEKMSQSYRQILLLNNSSFLFPACACKDCKFCSLHLHVLVCCVMLKRLLASCWIFYAIF